MRALTGKGKAGWRDAKDGAQGHPKGIRQRRKKGERTLGKDQEWGWWWEAPGRPCGGAHPEGYLGTCAREMNERP